MVRGAFDAHGFGRDDAEVGRGRLFRGGGGGRFALLDPLEGLDDFVPDLVDVHGPTCGKMFQRLFDDGGAERICATINDLALEFSRLGAADRTAIRNLKGL